MIKTSINGTELFFETNEKVFSPSRIDRGTYFMLETAKINPEDKVLDLGCGYGAVGIYCAKITGPDRVVMSDISAQALSLAHMNSLTNKVLGIRILESDGFEKIEDRDFTVILSNPPYHADFKVPKSFIEKGYKALSPGGKMYMVTKRRKWYKNKFISVFGGVRIYEREGYYIFEGQKIKRGDK